MSSETLLAILYLIVSVCGFSVQSVALIKLWRWHFDGSRKRQRLHYGMVRTAASRVTCAVAYVSLGIITLIARETFPVLGLAVFSFTQIVWQANSIADLRLKKDLSENGDESDSTRWQAGQAPVRPGEAQHPS